MTIVERRYRRLVYREQIETLAVFLAALQMETPEGPERDRLKSAGWHLLRAADTLPDPVPVPNNGNLETVLSRSLDMIAEQKRRLAEAVQLNANHES